MITSLPTIAISIMMLLFIIEVIHSYKEDKHLYKTKDTLSNLGVGIGYFVSSIPSKGLQFFIFQWVSKYSLFHISERGYIWVIAILAADFSYYWYHRASHEI